MVVFFTALLFCTADTQTMVRYLGNNSFYIRQTTHEVLSQKIDSRLYRQLFEIKKSEKDPEITNRLSVILKEYADKAKEEFKIDLMGYKDYPRINEGMPGTYALDDPPWKEWKRSGLINYYSKHATVTEAEEKRFPYDFTLRRATQLWMQERIDYDFESSIRTSKSEKEFRAEMEKRMQARQKDMKLLIEGDKKFFARNKQDNPFLEEGSKITKK